MSKSDSKNLVLIAVMNNGTDLHIANTEHWYRIPVKSAPKRLENTDYLAFYLTKAFGDQKWSIPSLANITRKSIVKRSELLPLESDHPRANDEYYKLELDDFKPLDVPIISRKGRRITFITATVEKFKSAQEINDLFDESPLEDTLWTEFKKSGIYAERQFPIMEKKNHYFLDFALFCRDKNIDVECDGDTWHIQPDRAISDNARDNFLVSKGWSVLRFSTKQINEGLVNCLDTVVHTANKLGGFTEIGEREIDGFQFEYQPDLFGYDC